jgi:hypothetical protein
MDHKKNQNEDMNAFEAAMASLRPKADQLERRWNDRLAGEARRLCNHPDGHRYACVHCGAAVPPARGLRRWAWPAATAAMTAAALLLLMLAVRSSDRIASDGNRHDAETRSVEVAGHQTNPTALESSSKADSRSAADPRASMPILFDSESMSYLSLRQQTMRFGGESWDSSMLATAASTNAKETPLGSRQLLQRMLKQQGWNGS